MLENTMLENTIYKEIMFLKEKIKVLEKFSQMVEDWFEKNKAGVEHNCRLFGVGIDGWEFREGFDVNRDNIICYMVVFFDRNVLSSMSAVEVRDFGVYFKSNGFDMQAHSATLRFSEDIGRLVGIKVNGL